MLISVSEVCRSILTEKRSESPSLGVWKLGGKRGGQGAGVLVCSYSCWTGHPSVRESWDIYMLVRSSLTQSVNIFPFYVKSVSDTSKVGSCFPTYSLFDPNQTT